MHKSVADAWLAFNEPLECRVHGMYVDIKGLITCGVGNLIDPIVLAEQLPWSMPDGKRATLEQVRADWHRLKGDSQRLARLHYKYALAATQVRLADADIDALVARKRTEFERYLQLHHFPEWPLFPADAQLGIASMAWACGPGFPATFKNFKRCVINRDWTGAIASCKIREIDNPGVVPRNARNRLCFANAAIVEKRSLDVSQLFWPAVPPPPGPVEPTDDHAQALHAIAVYAQTFAADVVGTPGANLRDYEAAPDDDGTDPAPSVA